MAAAAPVGAAVPSLSYAPINDLIRLSALMGELHALRVSCAGLNDQRWRDRMRQLLDHEAAGTTNRRDAMVNAFNRGYANGGNGQQRCSPSLTNRERDLAVEGRSLANRLADHYVVQR